MLNSTDAVIAFKFLLEGEAVFWQTLYRRKMTLEEVLRLPTASEVEEYARGKILHRLLQAVPTLVEGSGTWTM